jgi:hypothetical protein
MLRLGSRECLGNCAMARATILRRDILCIGDSQRLVSRVTGSTGTLGHIGRVSLMALEARRNIPVRFVTGRAEELRMAARVLSHLRSLEVVTGQAGGREICGELHLHWSMRIRMAGVTAADLEMGLARMAIAADGDDILLADHRRMPLVTIDASDRCLMPSSLVCDNGNNA